MNISTFPVKTFSISKLNELKECERKYYYNVFGSHNGWLSDANEETRQLYKYKKLTSLPLVEGNALHAAFKESIIHNVKGQGVSITEEDCKSLVFNKMKEAINESKRNLTTNSFEKSPSKNIMLQEYYFNHPMEKEELEAVKDKVINCIDNFFCCQTYEDLLNDRNIEIIEVDESDFNNPMKLGCTTLFFKVDLLYKKNDMYYVVDWKTGRAANTDKEQLMVYVYYIVQKYEVPLNKIVARIEYLATGEIYEVTPLDTDLEYINNKVIDGIQLMDDYLVDKELNIPKPKEEFLQIEECGLCHWCNYRLACGYKR